MLSTQSIISRRSRLWPALALGLMPIPAALAGYGDNPRTLPPTATLTSEPWTEPTRLKLAPAEEEVALPPVGEGEPQLSVAPVDPTLAPLATYWPQGSFSALTTGQWEPTTSTAPAPEEDPIAEAETVWHDPELAETALKAAPSEVEAAPPPAMVTPETKPTPREILSQSILKVESPAIPTTFYEPEAPTSATSEDDAPSPSLFQD